MNDANQWDELDLLFQRAKNKLVNEGIQKDEGFRMKKVIAIASAKGSLVACSAK